MLNAGLDAMVSDVDVVWMQPPWPLVRYGDASQPRVRPNAALLALADVILSVDQAPRSRRDPGWRHRASSISSRLYLELISAASRRRCSSTSTAIATAGTSIRS